MNMLSVYIVDDKEIICKGLSSIISNLNFDIGPIYWNTNSEKAKTEILSLKPNIIFMDIQMPFLNGLELGSFLRDNGINSYIIIISGYNDFTYAQKAFTINAFRYLLKPINKIHLEELLINIINIEKFKPHQTKNPSDINPSYPPIICKAISFIIEKLDKNITLSDVADHVELTSNYFCHIFKQYIPEGFSTFLLEQRINRSIILLNDPSRKIYEIAYMVGFTDEKYFTKQFKKLIGISPTAYRTKQT